MNESILALDTEGTTSNMGNPFDQTNRLVCYSAAQADWADVFFRDEDGDNQVRRLLESCTELVLFNAKFDLHWLNRVGIDFSGKRIWDCQLAEFILSRQTWKYPDMATTAQNYGLPCKLDIVKTEYWKKGIDTPDIPRDILYEYAQHDARLTYDIRLCQLERFKEEPALYKLFRLQCADLLILLEMEAAGLVLREDIAEAKSKELHKELEQIENDLRAIYPDIPINFGSNDQLSAFLYGGIISEVVKQHDGFYKSGKRAGEPKFKNVVIEHQLPRLFEPLKGSELKKEGVYSTSEDTLQKLRGKHRKLVEKLLRMSEIRKLLSTYYDGLIALNRRMNWPPGRLFGQYNQVVARTSRLSSSNPNLQNLSGDSLDMFVTRF